MMGDRWGGWRKGASARVLAGLSARVLAGLLAAFSATGGGAPAALAGPEAGLGDGAPRIWFHDSWGRLGVLDLSDGSVIDLGVLDVVLTDIAFGPDGRLYGISFDALYEVDPVRRAVRLIGGHGVPCGNAFEIAPDGRAYAMGCSTGGLYRMDLRTGRSQHVASLPAASSGDLAYHQGRLLVSARGGAQGDVLMAIDLEALTAEILGETGEAQLYGLAADNAYGVFAGAGLRYFRIDERSGGALEIGRIQSSRFSQVYGWAMEPSADAPVS